MSPLNRGSAARPRGPMRPPMPRFTGQGPMPPLRPPVGRTAPPMIYGGFMPGPPRPGPMMVRPGGRGVPPPMFRDRPHIPPPMPPIPPMMRGPMCPRGPMMPRPGPRGVLPPHAFPHHMKPRFPPHANGKGKGNLKKGKVEDLELKKPWMTDEIRSEIQKKNKLYAKAKKNKDAKEWEEFKDLRNKVTRMIRDAKNEYLQKNPDQTHLDENDDPLEDGNDDDNDTDIDKLYTDSEEEIAENIDAYCEVCDREFQSEELLNRHMQEHQTCNIDGCLFTAHPKIVEKHIIMQHHTGLYSRMKNIVNDGDIEKWKAERKRKYPTVANNELKKAEQIEKEKHGEIVQSNQNQKNRLFYKTSKKDMKKTRKRKHKIFQAPIQKNEEIIEKKTYRGLLPFAGTAVLFGTEQSDVFSIEDWIDNVENNQCKVYNKEKISELKINHEISQNIDEVKQSIQETLNTKNVESPMLSLVADYESDSDNDELPQEVPIKKMKSNEDEVLQQNGLETIVESNVGLNNVDFVENSSTSLCDNREENLSTNNVFQNKTDIKGNIDLLKSSECNKLLDKNKKKMFENKQKFHNNKRNHVEVSSTRLNLLNKLLARSIQHERNVILQCIKFIANNNFFE